MPSLIITREQLNRYLKGELISLVKMDRPACLLSADGVIRLHVHYEVQAIVRFVSAA